MLLLDSTAREPIVLRASDPGEPGGLIRAVAEALAGRTVVTHDDAFERHVLSREAAASQPGLRELVVLDTRELLALTHPDLRIPEQCPYYSTNEGNFKTLDESTQQAVTSLRDTYSLRYVGSLVADFHRNLLKGGIFLYPADRNRPEGRLRLMYEANPLGFVAEQAGGAASTGRQRIMDIVPQQLHQRTPLILGNKDVVEKTVAIIGAASPV